MYNVNHVIRYAAISYCSITKIIQFTNTCNHTSNCWNINQYHDQGNTGLDELKQTFPLCSFFSNYIPPIWQSF